MIKCRIGYGEWDTLNAMCWNVDFEVHVVLVMGSDSGAHKAMSARSCNIAILRFVPSANTSCH